MKNIESTILEVLQEALEQIQENLDTQAERIETLESLLDEQIFQMRQLRN